jgi:signal peptidase II
VKPVRFYLLALIIVIIDQATKWSVQAKLPLNNFPVPVVGRFLFLTHTRNTGGAFSLFQAGNSMFIVVAGLAIVALVYAYHRMKRTDLAVTAALALAFGGAVGNLIDRIRYGYVVDFFDIQNGSGKSIWPIFNVADSAITVGIILLAIHFMFAKPQPENQPETETAARHDDTTIAKADAMAVMNANERE